KACRRLHGDDGALAHGGLRQRLHEALPGDGGARAGAVVPFRPELGRADLQELQPLPLRARARLHLVQHPAMHQLGDQWHGRALPQIAGDLDRIRSRLGAVPDAAARSRIHAAAVGGAASEEEAVRLHARHVLLVTADGDSGLRGDGVHVPHDECGNAAPLFVGLSALGLRSAVDDLGSAVPVGKGQAQYSRRHRGAVVQAAAAQRETESESPTLRQSGSGGLTARTEKEIGDETFGLCSGRTRNRVRWLSRARRLRAGAVRGRNRTNVAPTQIGYQDSGGRVTRYLMRSTEKTDDKGSLRDVQLGHRWMDAMSVDYSCLFPTGMLNIGMHPQKEMEVELCWAYNRWLTEKVMPEAGGRFYSMLCLPFSDPEA